MIDRLDVAVGLLRHGTLRVVINLLDGVLVNGKRISVSWAYNTRYLILPWVSVKYLASHLLSTIIRRISEDWEQAYNHPLYYLETFVDSQKFVGTTYKASNWIFLGKTKGLGKLSKTKIVDRSLKEVYGYPLSKNFREVLCR